MTTYRGVAQKIADRLGLAPGATGEEILAKLDTVLTEVGEWSGDFAAIADAVGLDNQVSAVRVADAIEDLKRQAVCLPSVRIAAGLPQYTPLDRVVHEIAEMRQERVAVRRALQLDPGLHSVAVYDAIDRLRQRDAAPSNAAWLAQAWDGLCRQLEIPLGASLDEAVIAIDQLKTDAKEAGTVVALNHQIRLLQQTIVELRGEGRVTDDEAEKFIKKIKKLHTRYCKASGLDPALHPDAVVEELRRREEYIDQLNKDLQIALLELGLPSGASRGVIILRVRELREGAAKGEALDLLVERASAVRDLLGPLTSATARMGLSLEEVSR